MSHQYHMQEIYREAALIYRQMVEDSSLDKQFCSCANDILDNGVMSQLVEVAKRFKYGSAEGKALDWSIKLDYDSVQVISNNAVSREKRSTAEGKAKDWSVTFEYDSVTNSVTTAQKYTDRDIARLKLEYLENSNKRTAAALLATGGWQPNTVTGPDQWITYSAMLTHSLPSDQQIRDFAAFIFCKLNYPEV